MMFGFWKNNLRPLIPIMTASSLPKGLATASTNNGVNVPYMAFDNQTSTRWNSLSQTPGNSIFLQYRFAESHIIHGYLVGWATITAAFDFAIQISNNGSTWTTIATNSLFNTSSSQIYMIPNGVSCSYVRYQVINTPSSATLGLHTFQVYGY